MIRMMNDDFSAYSAPLRALREKKWNADCYDENDEDDDFSAFSA
jgi:hypothetical protein